MYNHQMSSKLFNYGVFSDWGYDPYQGILIDENKSIPSGSILYKRLISNNKYELGCHFGIYFNIDNIEFVIDWNYGRYISDYNNNQIEIPCLQQTFDNFRDGSEIYYYEIRINVSQKVLLEKASWYLHRQSRYDFLYANCEQFVMRCIEQTINRNFMDIPKTITFNLAYLMKKEDINHYTRDSIQSREFVRYGGIRAIASYLVLSNLMTRNQSFIKKI